VLLTIISSDIQDTFHILLVFIGGCNVMIASRKADRLESAVAELQHIKPSGDEQQKPKLEYMTCSIRKENEVQYLQALYSGFTVAKFVLITNSKFPEIVKICMKTGQFYLAW
jgi:hypothetical protein